MKSIKINMLCNFWIKYPTEYNRRITITFFSFKNIYLYTFPLIRNFKKAY